jgi:hypothetical protein
LLLAPLGLADDEAPKPAEPGTLIVIDPAGKEQKLKAWKFTAGVTRLSWLAPADKSKEKDEKKARPAAAGPEALAIREEAKIKFLAGVMTLVPLDRVRAVTFDSDKQTMTVRAATSGKPEEDVTLTGTTAYKGINKVSLEAEVNKGDAGIAEVTYQGGVARGGIKGIRFPAPKVTAEKPGRPAVVLSADGDIKQTHKVSDLLPLYRLKAGREKAAPLLFFRKTLKLDVTKIKSISAGGDDSDDLVWQVVQKDGDDSKLTLLQSVSLDGQPAELVGLVGKVPAGYKLFPLRRISAVHFDTSEEPKEADKDKEKDKDKDKDDKG